MKVYTLTSTRLTLWGIYKDRDSAMQAAAIALNDGFEDAESWEIEEREVE